MRTLLALLILVSTNCFGQSGITFTDTNATWNVSKTYPHGNMQNPNFVETVTKIYGFIGDTTIGTEQWKILYFTTDSVFSPSSDMTLAGYIRENNDIVFFIDTLGVSDTLYDFNLAIGDSIDYNFNGTYYFINVLNIDSIIINGSYQKRFFFSELPVIAFDYLHEVWIEDIGSIHGPLFPAYPTAFSTEMPDSMNLTCYKVNDTILWFNTNYPDCYTEIILTVDKRYSTREVIVFPNPVADELNVVLPKKFNGEFSVRVYDLTGRLTQVNYNISNGKLAINTSDLRQNVYILYITSGEEEYTIKFIKQ